MFPSICCKMIINTRKQKLERGEMSSRMKAPMPAPIKAPKIGIRAVIPIIVLISMA